MNSTKIDNQGNGANNALQDSFVILSLVQPLKLTNILYSALLSEAGAP
jgi:hypothetical protein